MLRITQYLLRHLIPKLNAGVARVLYCSGRIRIGDNLRADGVPRILVDNDASVEIGDNVEMRSGVEIRAHGRARIVIGSNTRIDRGVRILAANAARIHICEGARIGLYSVLNGGDSITVGSKALISGFVYLQTSMHGHRDAKTPIQEQGYDHAPVKLGADTWLGTHVVVMPGVTIENGAIVGSNAVVTADVEANTVVAGVPARPIRNREGG